MYQSTLKVGLELKLILTEKTSRYIYIYIVFCFFTWMKISSNNQKEKNYFSVKTAALQRP